VIRSSHVAFALVHLPKDSISGEEIEILALHDEAAEVDQSHDHGTSHL